MPEKKPVNKISSFTRSEIAQLFKQARISVRCTGLRILTVPTNNISGKILIVTPKASGNSPTRNLFRRRVRASFRESNLFEYEKDFVIIVNKRGIDTSFSKINQLLLSAAKNKK